LAFWGHLLSNKGNIKLSKKCLQGCDKALCCSAFDSSNYVAGFHHFDTRAPSFFVVGFVGFKH